MRLRTKFAVALLALTVLLSGATVAGLEFYKQQAVTEVQGNVDETAGVIADQIDSTLRERRDFVGYIASQPAAARFNRSDSYLEAFLTNSRFYAAQIIAANGTVVAFRGDITDEQRRQVIGSDRSDAPYVQAGLKGGYIGTAQPAERPNRPDTHALVFSAPIFDADGDVTGVFAAAMFLTDQTVFDMVPAAETSTQTVTITADSEPLHQRDRSFTQPIDSTATVEATGWTVTVARDRSALNSRLEHLALVQGGGLLLVLFSMVGFGYWQYAVSLRQTERLLDGFESIREGDYGERVSLSGGAEWERIGEGVNELASGLRQREAALRERQQRLEVLHRVLRHNVRNRMSIVLNYADIIGDMSEDDVLVEAAETIEDAGGDLTRLSQKAGQMENVIEASDQAPEPVEVGTLLREVIAEFDEEYPEVDIGRTGEETAWALAGPSFRLAVENAVENACKHNDSDDPQVEVHVESQVDTERPGGSDGPTEGDSPPGHVRVEIRDNGPGIPEQDRSVIEEGRETDLEHGSGLGLWLVYWIVDNAGGRLSFAENEPRGSIVRMDLRRGPSGEVEASSETGETTDATDEE